MKILFLIQGEGNGHLTQAVSLHQILVARGHEIVAAMIASPGGTKKPEFFCKAVRCPVYPYKSIGLAYSKNGHLRVGATLARLVSALPALTRSLRYIDTIVRETQPDLIVNFYETTGGLYKLLYKNHLPVCCIAHQYLFFHPDFRFPEKRVAHRFGLTLLSKVTALKASRVFALSFSDLYASTEKLTVVPPLLRQEVRQITPVRGQYILVYLTLPSLFRQVEEWHRKNPSMTLHCFCNHPFQNDTIKVDDTLFLHPTGTGNFLDLLKGCKALVSTSGFESICEAMLLGKPVMMIPVPNHYEQECNALDAEMNKIGLASKTFRPELLPEPSPAHRKLSEKTKQWLDQTPELLLHSLESLVFPG